VLLGGLTVNVQAQTAEKTADAEFDGVGVVSGGAHGTQTQLALTIVRVAHV